MNCRHALNCISAYLDRELPGDQMLTVRSHIERCPDCRKEFESLKSLKSELCALPMHEPSSNLEQNVLRMVRAAEPSSPQGRRSWGVLVATSVAAAALALFAFNTFFGATTGSQVADDASGFDVGSDGAVTSPFQGSHAPIVPAGRR